MALVRVVRRGTVELVCDEYGRDGPGVLLLHGLAGYAGEWAATMAGLAAAHRVVAFDQRGHGRSTTVPGDVSRAAYVADAVAVIEATAVGPVVLVGQSLGGHTAFLLAAERPDLVSALVVVEASPDRDPGAPGRVAHWLSSWPTPFPSREAAVAFFATRGGARSREAALAWATGLEARHGQWWPAFDAEVGRVAAGGRH